MTTTVFPEAGRRLWTAAACCRFCARSLLRGFGIGHDCGPVQSRTVGQQAGYGNRQQAAAVQGVRVCWPNS